MGARRDEIAPIAIVHGLAGLIGSMEDAGGGDGGPAKGRHAQSADWPPAR